MRFQSPRGTQDILPKEVHLWQYSEKFFFKLTSQYGYHEIRTPIFEDTELFKRTSGETSDIVSKEMYTFNDYSERSLTLKPEGTAPAMRAYIQHNLGTSSEVVRLCYATPFFRYGRPQKGRLRQAHQLGLELVGSPSPAADAEIIEITVRYFEGLELENIHVFINSIGKVETRKKYAEVILRGLNSFLSDQETEFQEKTRKNPLRLLDSKDPKIIDTIQDLPSILDFLEDDSKRHFASLQELLSEAKITFSIKPSIVRGLDYYTDTVFEIQSHALGAQNSLCGGGRYDGLIKQLGGQDTPSVGVGIGLERTLLAMPEKLKLIQSNQLDIFLIHVDENSKKDVRALSRKLRMAGLKVSFDLDGKALKKQTKLAAQLNAKFAGFIGEEERETGYITVKHLESSRQEKVLFEDLPSYLLNR